jgi:hypothetical protein
MPGGRGEALVRVAALYLSRALSLPRGRGVEGGRARGAHCTCAGCSRGLVLEKGWRTLGGWAKLPIESMTSDDFARAPVAASSRLQPPSAPEPPSPSRPRVRPGVNARDIFSQHLRPGSWEDEIHRGARNFRAAP